MTIDISAAGLQIGERISIRGLPGSFLVTEIDPERITAEPDAEFLQAARQRQAELRAQDQQGRD